MPGFDQASAEARFEALFGATHGLPKRRMLGRGLGAAMVFALALWLGSQGLRAWLRQLPGISVEEPGSPRLKSVHWREHGAEYDLVMLGSSRIFRQLDPEIFVLACERRELSIKAYNYGLPGMRGYECLQRVEDLLRDKPERLKWLVIELLPNDPWLPAANLHALREIQWHTPYLTRLALERSWRAETPRRAKFQQLGYHAYQGAARFLNLGAVENAWLQWLDTSPPVVDLAKAGFFGLEHDHSALVVERRRAYMTEI